MDAAAAFPSTWSRLISEWRQPDGGDRSWLMYSANYLFRTSNILWALDPIRLKQRLPEAPDVDLAADLDGLSFVLLTHQHRDHLDIDLIRALRHLPITWVVPSFLYQMIKVDTGLPSSRIIVPRSLESLDLEGIRITPFESLHWEAASPTTPDVKGVPAMGYLIEFTRKRWLFPGDTRTFRAESLPSLGPVDGVFAHVWLGRHRALNRDAPLLEAYCRFYLSLNPTRIILTHLREFGRGPEDYWDESHAQRVSSRLSELAPGISISYALLGDSIAL
jgi:L-ascorbate metabolism protein UlaG (beta-lactamase superfamily)